MLRWHPLCLRGLLLSLLPSTSQLFPFFSHWGATISKLIQSLSIHWWFSLYYVLQTANPLHLVHIVYLPGLVGLSASLLLALVFTVRKLPSQSLCETTPPFKTESVSFTPCVFPLEPLAYSWAFTANHRCEGRGWVIEKALAVSWKLQGSSSSLFLVAHTPFLTSR